MKKHKRLFYILIIVYAVFLFVYITFNDIKFLKNGYHIIDNKKLEKHSIIVENKKIDYYKYQNFVIISENSTNLSLNDFKEFIMNFDNIIIAEFSDFGFLFDKYKIYLNNSELRKIRYAHYIKPKEMDKYNISQITQRFWRAFNERRINVFYIPSHKKRNEIIKSINNKLKNIDKNIPPLFNTNRWLNYLTLSIISIYLLFLSPILSISYIVAYIFFTSWSYVFLAIVFSFIIWIKWKNKYFSIKNVFNLLLLTIIFGILIYGTGYTYLLVYKISVIRGVKLLLITLPITLFIVQLQNFKLNKKDIIFSSIVLISIYFYYILRSGNFGFATMFERNLRDMLEKLLIARPRFKELFSYIFIFSNPPTRFFKIFWNIGQSILFISVLDTFLHFQTPLYLGVLRTLNAFIITLFLYKMLKKILFKRKNSNN
ncbi:DUF5693 family protein [Marinitoga sp. 1155]|uniref:DUF5693 family protein n=1 Tax=Marinitoga sp. 1155 TaxID=1428448 RepID=UPI0006417722|nr:DUF5693 family protein [Marinitoga sp. 1155]KLO23680.1 hypothetical protein X274_05705 [Marinitoga sp. 1155]